MTLEELPKAPGIYLLTHAVTGDTYVGSAMCIRDRVRSHLWCLSRGRHTNSKMSALCVQHGVAFMFDVLELTGNGKRFPAESKWATTLRPTLNLDNPPKVDRRQRLVTRGRSVRLNKLLFARMVAFSAACQFKPKLARIIELAVTEWLDKHEQHKHPKK